MVLKIDWKYGPNMSYSRIGHTVTKLIDGNILVAGGHSSTSPVLECELYNSSTGKWEIVGSLNTSRIDHVDVILSNGNVMIIGGFIDFSNSKSINSCEIYDINKKTWSKAASMNHTRQDHVVALRPDNNVFVACGFGGIPNTTYTYLNSIEIYNPVNNSWTLSGVTQIPRRSPSIHIINDKAYIIGGNDINGNSNLNEEYDLNSNLNNSNSIQTKIKASLSTVSNEYGSIVYNNKIIIFGGLLNQNVFSLKIISYDPMNNVWNDLGVLNHGRYRHSYVLDNINKKLIIIGGIGSTTLLTNCEIFDLELNTSTSTVDLKLPLDFRGKNSAVLINKKVFVFGCVDINNNIINKTQVYGLFSDLSLNVSVLQGINIRTRKWAIDYYDKIINLFNENLINNIYWGVVKRSLIEKESDDDN